MPLRVKVLQPPSCRKDEEVAAFPVQRRKRQQDGTGHPSADASPATDPITSLTCAAWI
jgi:hypothetical protein